MTEFYSTSNISSNEKDPYTMTEERLTEKQKHIDKGRFITQIYVGFVSKFILLTFT